MAQTIEHVLSLDLSSLFINGNCTPETESAEAAIVEDPFFRFFFLRMSHSRKYLARLKSPLLEQCDTHCDTARREKIDTMHRVLSTVPFRSSWLNPAVEAGQQNDYSQAVSMQLWKKIPRVSKIPTARREKSTPCTEYYPRFLSGLHG